MTDMQTGRRPGFIRRIWRWFWSPSGVLALGALLIVGFIGGILFWGGFHWALEATNNEEFCISCHEMRDNVYAEYQGSVHQNNHSGVRATCPDCHVPKEWGYKIIRKIQASKELYGHFVTGVIDTPEKFEEHRLDLAGRVWTAIVMAAFFLPARVTCASHSPSRPLKTSSSAPSPSRSTFRR